VLKTVAGRSRDVHPLLLLMAGLLVARYVFLT
jgi:hypothetical protein